MIEKIEKSVSQKSETSESSEEVSLEEGISSIAHVNNLMTILLESPTPHLMFIDVNYDIDYFNEHRGLVNTLLGEKGGEIAEKLANSTPQEVRSNIARLVQTTFPNTNFPSQVQAAFERKRNQEMAESKEEKPQLESTEDSQAKNDSTDSTTATYSKETSSDEEQNSENHSENKIIVEGKALEHIEVISNPIFAQSELNRRKPKGDTFFSLPNSVDDDNQKGPNCCEKYCTLL